MNEEKTTIELSIIVPVYKVEKYLDQCVQSLINQTFKNMEIILVDDGSPDRCGEMCEYYANQYDNIIAIHKANGGISSARNYGIKFARADIIGFVDSDDWIDPGMYEKLMSEMNTCGADISRCEARQVWDDGRVCEPKIDSIECIRYEGEDTLLKNYDNFSAWNKIYKKTLFQDVRFPEGKLYEDARTMYRLYSKADVATSTNQCFYNYRQRKSSIMGTFSIDNYIDRVSVWNEIYEFMEKKFPDRDLSYIKIRKRKLALEILNVMRVENIIKKNIAVSQTLFKEIEYDELGFRGYGLKERAKLLLIKRQLKRV